MRDSRRLRASLRLQFRVWTFQVVSRRAFAPGEAVVAGVAVATVRAILSLQLQN